MSRALDDRRSAPACRRLAIAQLAFEADVTFAVDDQTHVVREQPVDQRQEKVDAFLRARAE